MKTLIQQQQKPMNNSNNIYNKTNKKLAIKINYKNLSKINKMLNKIIKKNNTNKVKIK